MVTNYQRGRHFEYRVRQHFIKEGYIVLRSAGSHTFSDLLAMKGGEILLIQCKTDGYLPAPQREALLDAARENCCQAWLARKEKGKLRLVRLEPNQPK